MTPLVVLQPNLPNTSRKKRYGCGNSYNKRTIAPPHDEATRLTTMLPNYVSLRPFEAPKITIGKNVKYQLISPSIPQRV